MRIKDTLPDMLPILDCYSHVLKYEGPYNSNEFAEAIADVYDLSNPRNQAVYNWLKQNDTTFWRNKISHFFVGEKDVRSRSCPYPLFDHHP